MLHPGTAPKTVQPGDVAGHHLLRHGHEYPGLGPDHTNELAEIEKKFRSEHAPRHGDHRRAELRTVSETAPALNGATRALRPSGGSPASGAAISFRDVTKRFPTAKGGIYTAIRDVNLEIRPGEFCTVVGPTGCGKSTMLGLIAGLIRPSSGTVGIDGHQVTAIGDRIGYVFQNDAIFPWRSVLDNVAAGPRYRGRSRKEARSLACEWITRVGLKGFEDRYPHQLSGGMRKRVALAQTLINEPQILLMDEPFSALDVQTRTLMENELLTLWSTTYASVVFVTHDLEEAIALADRVFVITAGPGTIKSSYRIDLPRPRNVSEIRFLPQFLETYQTIWNDLREEVLVSYERAKHAG